MEQINFFQKAGNTRFVIGEGRADIKELFGIRMYQAPRGAAWRAASGVDLFTSLGEAGEKDMCLLQFEKTEDEVVLYSSCMGGVLKHCARYRMDGENGILSRTDTIENAGTEPVVLYRLQPRFLLGPGEYDCYVQNSTWCYENQGGWEPVGRSGVCLENEGGRTTQGGTPLLGLRSSVRNKGLAFHILPKGNWEIRLNRASPGVGPQGSGILALRLGQASGHFSCTLGPGESMTMPEILIQALPEGVFHTETEKLHRFLRKRDKTSGRIPQKVVYNPWYDCYDHIDEERMLMRAGIAAELGCEVFEVDAGWYGQCSDWSASVGDWREKQDGAFFGNLKGFAGKIRKLGMEFGLWMEPERIAENAPMRLEHPEWFSYGSSGCYYPRLWVPEVYDYIKGEMCRLIEDYGLVWMKIDFNFELGQDDTGTELMRYYESWYGLLDEVREHHPEVFLEGCASGGLRTDVNTMMHVDGHFVCDNVNPIDNLSMFEQLIIRALPSKIYRWAAVQRGAEIPTYFRDKSDTEKTVVVPQAPGAGFGEYEKLDLDFLCKLTFNGMIGLTGDIATLEPDELEVLKAYIAFYKEYRPLFQESLVSMDFEPVNIGERSHWRVLSFYGEGSREQLIYVYRFHDICGEQAVYPGHIEDEVLYLVKQKEHQGVFWGKQLRENGILVELGSRNSAEIIHISEYKAKDSQ